MEGFHLIEEAASSDAEIKPFVKSLTAVAVGAGWLAVNKEISTFLVSDEVMTAMSDLPTPQGILAVMTLTSEDTPDFSGGWLLLDNVQDPGNVGTMIRTADAGMSLLKLCKKQKW
ncbi:hypothetical protein EfmJHP36_22790 [Enterococcus faecium]|nr:hypothetical protein EfmJHP36_22790 [Enterococcus faecium]